jgi:glycerate-2-kinase
MKLQVNPLRNAATEIFNAAVKAVDPYTAVLSYAEAIRSHYRNGHFRRIVITGFGKAAYPMARAVSAVFGDSIADGLVITKYGHSEYVGEAVKNMGHIKVVEAGHPIPDENGLKGTEKIIELLAASDEKSLVICLISGGASALLVSPSGGIALGDKQKITELLLKSGADINELNTVRKHISRVKGGRLAEIACPAKIVSLILSDVIGDDIGVIASGPTAPDKTTFHDAIMVLEKYDLMAKTPKSVLQVLRKGLEGQITETPKEGNIIFGHVENVIIGGNGTALAAARQKAEELGFRTEILSSRLSGEARDAGKWLAGTARKVREESGTGSICLLSGGETTVTVKGEGVGGRNMELALAFAMEIDGTDGIAFLSAGSDGTDGPTEAAGAIVDGFTIERARVAGLDPDEFLHDNDSYNFFQKIEELFVTGPTGTNVMDIQIVIIE